MNYGLHVARALADAMALGPWEADALQRLCAEVLGGGTPWLKPLVAIVLGRLPDRPQSEEQIHDLARFITTRGEFYKAFGVSSPRVRRHLGQPPRMAERRWPVPVVNTHDELAQLLEIAPLQLAWLADAQQYLSRARGRALSHYHRQWIAKPSGGHRLLETPKPLIKAVQRRVLQRILDVIPVHGCAHGFVLGRSPLTHAAQHAGQPLVLRIDLEDFFTSIGRGPVFGVFRTAGYPIGVARTLSSLCTTRLPFVELGSVPRPTMASEVARQHRLRRKVLQSHLPQGAPTSPALANLCALGLDRRLQGAARTAGVHYSRYADDLVFSGAGEFGRRPREFATLVAQIAIEEGFNVNFHKTATMHQSSAQRVCGLIVNSRPNVPRQQYDRLKAILTNCVRHGVASQNSERHPDFRAHLRGKIAWVQAIAPARGSKLLGLFEALDWDARV